MATRRHFVQGLLAASLAPRPSWAEAGSPAYLAAARGEDGLYRLVGLTARGEAIFTIPLPDRGHAAAAHPSRPDAVAFARRPGTFAVVFDCRDGAIRARLSAPEGRVFYGHGSYTADGAWLFTTEMDTATARGRIGVWDVAAGYLRAGDFSSGGVGPHEVLRLPNGDFAIANGGIETGGKDGREKLNLDIMAPNLAYVSEAGSLLEVVELAPGLHQHSIRHVAARSDGLVAFGLQWQGDPAASPALLGLHKRDRAAVLVEAPEGLHRAMAGYVGSVAVAGDGSMVAITSPIGSTALVFDPDAGECIGSYQSPDICGVAAAEDGFIVTTGAGKIAGLAGITPVWQAEHRQAWDHHLVPIAAGPAPA